MLRAGIEWWATNLIRHCLFSIQKLLPFISCNQHKNESAKPKNKKAIHNRHALMTFSSVVCQFFGFHHTLSMCFAAVFGALSKFKYRFILDVYVIFHMTTATLRTYMFRWMLSSCYYYDYYYSHSYYYYYFHEFCNCLALCCSILFSSMPLPLLLKAYICFWAHCKRSRDKEREKKEQRKGMKHINFVFFCWSFFSTVLFCFHACLL